MEWLMPLWAWIDMGAGLRHLWAWLYEFGVGLRRQGRGLEPVGVANHIGGVV